MKKRYNYRHTIIKITLIAGLLWGLFYAGLFYFYRDEMNSFHIYYTIGFLPLFIAYASNRYMNTTIDVEVSNPNKHKKSIMEAVESMYFKKVDETGETIIAYPVVTRDLGFSDKLLLTFSEKAITITGSKLHVTKIIEQSTLKELSQ